MSDVNCYGKCYGDMNKYVVTLRIFDLWEFQIIYILKDSKYSGTLNILIGMYTTQYLLSPSNSLSPY